MLLLLAICFSIALSGAALVQLTLAILFARRFCRRDEKPLQLTADSPLLPKTAILMSVRGADPSLTRSVEGALEQTHNHYELHIVVDHEEDPAWEMLNAIQRQHPNGDRLKLQRMRDPLTTCGLKCHCLAQAAASLGDDVEHITLLDADVMPHPSWLVALTEPLEQDPSIGGVTGTQWFEPPGRASTGSWWRSTWNAGAMVPTIYFANPWAGSFAMRRLDLVRSGLLEAWKHSIVDDGPIREYLGNIGLRIEFAPSVIMVNRESCGTRYVIRWTTRMMTWSRLHEPTFYLTKLHAAFSNTLIFANALLLVLAIFAGFAGEGQYLLARIATLSGLLLSAVFCFAAYVVSRNCVRHSLQLRGESLGKMSGWQMWHVFWAAAPAHWAYGLACWRSIWVKQIAWRGINYRIKSKSSIERLNYEPFLKVPNRDETRSIW